MYDPQSHTPLSSQKSDKLRRFLRQPEKVFFVFFIVSVTVLGFSFWYFQSAIARPFRVTTSEPQTTDQEAIQRFQQLLEQQQTDTDQDGLADSLETSVYNTSPYLADSDSDGKTDKQEIDEGTDPNCPEGQNCTVIQPRQQQIAPEDLINTPASSFDEVLIQELRNALVTQGVSQELVDSISDQELISLYQQIATDVDAQAGASASDVATLRQQLIASGVDEAILADISDEELLQVYANIEATQAAE